MNTWLKTMGIFIGLMTVLVVVLTLSSSPSENDTSNESFAETRASLANILKNAGLNFTMSETVTQLPNLPINEDWLNDSQDDPFMGPENASIIVMEFSDFQCPFCKASFPAIREIISRYPRVKYIYRDWPVDELHPEARKAAEAAACAHEQEFFWPYHDRLFQNQHNLTDEALVNYAKQTGLDVDVFSACLKEGTFAAEVEQDRQIGIGLGVRGTPTWFINGEKIEGVIPQGGWDELFNAL
jgi:protein-disulfide isomerase